MKITARSTTKIVEVSRQGLKARIWEAKTEGGVKCHLYVTRVAVANGEDHAQFEKELVECAAPSEEIKAIPARLIF